MGEYADIPHNAHVIKVSDFLFSPSDTKDRYSGFDTNQRSPTGSSSLTYAPNKHHYISEPAPPVPN
jgi:hypothetical protein